MDILISASNHYQYGLTSAGSRVTVGSTGNEGGFGRERTSRPNQGRGTRHRLTVLANDVIDAVSGAGGLIFDRASSGWKVDVYLAEPSDERPLRILGVSSYGLLPGVLTGPTKCPDALVIAGELDKINRNVCHFFDAASHNHLTEVAIWGGKWPAELTSGVGRVEHRLSFAARAFKANSMDAAGVKGIVEATESFHCGAQRCNIAAPLRSSVSPARRR
jgi:hypothetical protein